MSRFLFASGLVVTLGWLGFAQGQDDKKEPEIVLKKRPKDDADSKKPAVKAEKEKENEKDKETDKKEKSKLPKLEPLPDESESAGEDPAKIIERIKKNLAGTDERLEKKDPGIETRKLQDQIVKDIDELIKQQQDQQNQGGGQASRSQQKSSSKSGSSGSSSSESPQSSGQKSSSGNKSASGQKESPKGSGQMASKDPKSGQSTAGKGQDPKDKSGKSGGLGGDSNQKGKNTVADLFKDIWGHLPQTRRLEMDAYSRERFMPRYEELLRQYYRTIAEQGRRKEGD